MSAVNNISLTPYEMLCADDHESLDEEVVTFVAAGLGFGVQTPFYRTEIAAVVIAGGGHVSADADDDERLAEERTALHRIEQRKPNCFARERFTFVSVFNRCV